MTRRRTSRWLAIVGLVLAALPGRGLAQGDLPRSAETEFEGLVYSLQARKATYEPYEPLDLVLRVRNPTDAPLPPPEGITTYFRLGFAGRGATTPSRPSVRAQMCLW